MSSRNLRENNSGCYDPVAAQAISHTDNEKINDAKKLGSIIKHMCDLAGFRIDGSFVLVHRKSGRRWVVKE